jgi:hypothetical protein
VRWPRGAFDSFALSGEPVLSRDVREEDLWNEEDRHRATLDDPRAADFALGTKGTDLAAIVWLTPAPRISGSIIEPAAAGSGASLDPHRRSRAALVDPLLSASIYSSEDLETALEELLPMEQDLLDIFRDADSEGDAEQSSDDRTSG